MNDTPLVVDRDTERAELQELLARGVPQLALLYGRRRVGKTYLLTHTWPADCTFYFTASNTTSEQNRRQLLAELTAWTGTDYPVEDYPTWRTVFRLLLEIRMPEPIAVVLDEFQYLGDDNKGLAVVASELNAAWEQRRKLRPFVLALSGSSVGTLEALATGGAPLYGRFAWVHQLKPFDYWYTGEMTLFRSLRDRAVAYGVYGGTPRYLATLSRTRPIGDQVARTMLSPRGEVRTLVETALLQEEGLRETQIYVAILRSIGAGSTELNAIAQSAGIATTTALREKVDRLIALGYVEAHRNLGAKRTDPFRYRLADPAFMFYHTFVAPHETALARYPAEQFWRDAVAPRLDTYMGHVFERMAEQAYIRLAPSRRLPIVQEWGRWEGRDRDGEPLEMDIAARIDNNRVLTGGVKWNRRPLGAELFHYHTRMVDRLAMSGVEWAHRAREKGASLLFVAAGGFTPAFQQAAAADPRNVTLWTLADLYVRAKVRSR